MRLGGELDILGLISVSLEFYLQLQHTTSPNELWGQATLMVHVEVLMFSETVECTVERRFAGPDDSGPSSLAALTGLAAPLPVGAPGASASPTFEDLVPTPADWDTYCNAFA